MAQKLEARGGKGGKQWDDLADHDNVTKLYVRGGNESGIQYVKFVYVKNGEPKTGSIHGHSASGFTQPFYIDRKNEYLVSVEGYYDEAKGVIKGLQFKTNMRASELMGSDDKGLKFFQLAVNGKKIIGFHGFADTHLNSLGAYFATAPPTRLDYEGGNGGSIWDDGPNYKGVRKISFSLANNEIRQIRFDYDKDGVVERREHGQNVGQQDEFVVDYPTEYILSVEGTTDSAHNGYVRSLIFKTSKGRTSKRFGMVNGNYKFVLECNGSALIGFHGRAAGCLDAIGAYFSPLIVPHAEKLQAEGGKGGGGGDPWDDGAFDGVREVHVGQGDNGINAVKFVYAKDSQEAKGNEHGTPTLLGYEPFKLDYPSEYITAVECCSDKIFGSENGVITMVKFKTNKQTSQPFGLESSSSFILGKEGYKIVGFHGNTSHELNQLGVHVVPI